MGYICTRCGGTNVTCEAIVNPVAILLGLSVNQ